jgi:hypothetical protein
VLSAKELTFGKRARNLGNNSWVRMPEHHRTLAKHEIDMSIPVHVDKVNTFPALEKERMWTRSKPNIALYPAWCSQRCPGE